MDEKDDRNHDGGFVDRKYQIFDAEGNKCHGSLFGRKYRVTHSITEMKMVEIEKWIEIYF